MSRPMPAQTPRKPAAAHTAGPWRATEPCPVSGWVDIVSGEDTGVYVPPLGSTRHDNAVANARLIAAAPEMLEALKRLCLGDGADDDWKAAEAAIAKAEGRDA